MQKVFLTGMSGVGKSSVIQSLRKMGFDALDMDDIGWSSFNDAGHQIWNEGRLQHALNSAAGDAFFVAGCAENQVRFYPQFTRIVLLSAPWTVMVERIMGRQDNAYGRKPHELQAIRMNMEEIEPLLRKSSTHEIVTTGPLEVVVEKVLNIAR
jgi:shikimate kinase